MSCLYPYTLLSITAKSLYPVILQLYFWIVSNLGIFSLISYHGHKQLYVFSMSHFLIFHNTKSSEQVSARCHGEHNIQLICIMNIFYIPANCFFSFQNRNIIGQFDVKHITYFLVCKFDMRIWTSLSHINLFRQSCLTKWNLNRKTPWEEIK
jgi:hypothetical protein